MKVRRATPTTGRPTDGVDAPAPFARRFEAVMFDWDGTAVADRSADASAVRGVVETLCACGVDVAVVSGTHLENVDGQLGARPSGPGRLLMALNRGSELFEIDAGGSRVGRRHRRRTRRWIAPRRRPSRASPRVGSRLASCRSD